MRKGFFRAAALAALAAVIAVPSATTAVGTDSTALRNAVTVGAIKAHNAQFQTFANASTAEFGHPTRVDGSVGFTRSVDYVAAQMQSYGYDVKVQEFMFDRFEETVDPIFARTAPSAKTYVEETDFATMEYSGNGDVTAQVVPTNDIVLPSPGGSTSGCEASDFPAAVAGKIALIQRGTCTFRQKAENAQAAGAIGVVIFNEGDTEERSGILFGTLDPPQMTLPVIGTSTAVGEELLAAGHVGPDRGDGGRHPDGVGERDRRHARPVAPTARRRRRPPRLRPRRAGHQRQRQRLGDDPRDREAAERARREAGQPRALRLVGRRGVRPARRRALRRRRSRRRS